MRSEVFNEDFNIAAKRYKPNTFGFCIADPPYGIGEDGRKNHTRSVKAKAKDYKDNARYDNSCPDSKFFISLCTIVKCGFIFGANFMMPLVYRTFKPPRRHEVEEWMRENPKGWLLWDKENGENDFSDYEMAMAFNIDIDTEIIKYRWHGMLQADMKNKEERLHPNQKPAALYRYLYERFAKKGDLILDPMMGSQSSRIAAHQMGFDYIGYELDADYFTEGCKRFNLITAQNTLF